MKGTLLRVHLLLSSVVPLLILHLLNKEKIQAKQLCDLQKCPLYFKVAKNTYLISYQTYVRIIQSLEKLEGNYMIPIQLTSKSHFKLVFVYDNSYFILGTMLSLDGFILYDFQISNHQMYIDRKYITTQETMTVLSRTVFSKHT